MSGALYIRSTWVKMPADNADGYLWWSVADIFLNGEKVITRGVALRGDNSSDRVDVTRRTAIAMACNEFAQKQMTDIRDSPAVISPGVERSPAPE